MKTQTNAERQKKWRDTHKDESREYLKRYRAKYGKYNAYMNDYEDHQHCLEYRRFRTSTPRLFQEYPYHGFDTVYAGEHGWDVISINDEAGQRWLKDMGYRHQALLTLCPLIIVDSVK